MSKEFLTLLNTALEMEVAAEIQYYTHAEVISGNTMPGITAQLIDNAGDESAHAKTLRNLIANYLDNYPTMKISETHKAESIPEVLSTNIRDERKAIEHYKKTLKYIEEHEDMENYCTFERAIRLILIEEEAHVSELNQLR